MRNGVDRTVTDISSLVVGHIVTDAAETGRARIQHPSARSRTSFHSWVWSIVDGKFMPNLQYYLTPYVKLKVCYCY
jgi:hypothetical protein